MSKRTPSQTPRISWPSVSPLRGLLSFLYVGRSPISDGSAHGALLTFSQDYDYMGGGFYETVSRISKRITYNVAKAAFGFNDSSNIGKIHFAAIQAAAAFATSFPHIFPGESACRLPPADLTVEVARYRGQGWARLSSYR